MINFEAFFKVSYGLYIVSSGNSKKGNGFVSNSVFQVTAEPPQIGSGRFSDYPGLCGAMHPEGNSTRITDPYQQQNPDKHVMFQDLFHDPRQIANPIPIPIKIGIIYSPIIQFYI